ncbi:MAG: type II toxin-antitoxin system RelE/ParE family toxin [Elusimicrobiota bacterium]|nr:type II toxin-antitoxin system RelE/ParE family toxin [Elusimicrobiota bacterium]
MSGVLRLRPEAQRELAEALSWYEKQVAGLGADFLFAVDACFQSILRHPQANPVVHKTIRRALLRRFPYEIFYIAGRGRIMVLAVFHAKRDPKHWVGRA